MPVTFWELLSSHSKTTTMLKKYISGIFILALLAAAGILIAGRKAKEEAPACCKAVEKPCKPEAKPTTPATTLEHLSHQFISIPLISH